MGSIGGSGWPRSLLLAALCCVMLAACQVPGSPGERASTVAPGLPPGTDTVVREVVDGDTIVVGGGETVRLIGVDTPETRHPDKGVQCYGKEASRQTARLLPPGTRVRLVSDVERTDRYGRTLAYVVRLHDGLFVNAALVRDGYAQPLTIPPNVAHAEEFRALGRQAREANRGLWGACAQEVAGAGAAPRPTAGGTGCDPAYVGVCVPPPPPDLDCADVDERAFRLRTKGRDPHRFDGDGNGVGCG